MRRRTLVPLAALALLVAGLGPSPARAQVDGPAVPEVRERSGLFTRIVPIRPHLPPDKDRDLFYNSKWMPRHRSNWGHWINSWKDGGMYGQPLAAGCTTCRAPYFRGSPGAPTVDAACEPFGHGARVFGNIIHPFRPVDSYYSGGCYVPVYDLDPLVPGPGWFPWWVPDFANAHEGG
jgi:hypothetical protein